MDPNGFAGLLRRRWVLVCAFAAVSLGLALAISLRMTPEYESSTKLLVSTSTENLDEFSATLNSQAKVLTYTELVNGTNLAARALERVDAGLTPEQLAGRVTAISKPDSVLIDVKVRDSSPERARDLANALATELTEFVAEIETTNPNRGAAVGVTVVERASTPDSPVLPNTGRNAGLATAVGLVLGIGAAMLADSLSKWKRAKVTSA